MAQSAVFIALQASIEPSDKAMAASGLFLCFPIGAMLGMAGSSAIILGTLKLVVRSRLSDIGMATSAIDKVSIFSEENSQRILTCFRY